MSGRVHSSMAPDSHANLPDAAAADADSAAVTITSPLPHGILFKGNKPKKRVTFRDSNLVNIREIPPRSSSRSSSDEEESDEEDDSGSSDSDDDSDSDSEDGEEAGPAGGSRDKGAALAGRTSPSAPVPTVTAAPPGPRLRPERAPISWSSAPGGTAAKGSYELAASPASKVVSLVSHITGVSMAAAHAHLKQRAAASAAASGATSPTPGKAAPPPKTKPPSVVRVEKKVKKITPTLDTVITSQTVRSVHKHGAVSDSLHKGGGSSSSSSGKPAKKKRVAHRRTDGSDKRKSSPSSSSTASRKAKDVKGSNSGKANGETSWPGAKPSVKPVNGLGGARDSLSLPRLGADDSALLQSSRALQHMSLSKSTVYTLDGFIFPGDPAHDLAAGGLEESRFKPLVPSATPLSGLPVPRERVSSAPPSSPSRRRRYYAWQMANGNLQSTLHDSPCITPMWDTSQPAAPLTAKPAPHAAHR